MSGWLSCYESDDCIESREQQLCETPRCLSFKQQNMAIKSQNKLIQRESEQLRFEFCSLTNKAWTCLTCHRILKMFCTENHESFIPKITKVFVAKLTKVFVTKITKVFVPKITKVFVPKQRQRNISYTRQKIMHCKKWK